MAYVITRACVGVCDTGCVDVCPCDCIQGLVPLETLRKYDASERARLFPDQQMFIDPEHCVDCGACVPECPADAIYPEDMLPPGSDDAERNARFYLRSGAS